MAPNDPVMPASIVLTATELMRRLPFADGKSNYGGSWNGVNGSVTGLFYGDAGQLVAQLIGVATLVGFVFTLSFVINLLVDWAVGQRVSAKAELEGLDLPEMGQLGYPEFELKARPVTVQ